MNLTSFYNHFLSSWYNKRDPKNALNYIQTNTTMELAQTGNSHAISIPEQRSKELKIPRQGSKHQAMHTAGNYADWWLKQWYKHQTGIWSSLLYSSHLTACLIFLFSYFNLIICKRKGQPFRSTVKMAKIVSKYSLYITTHNLP